MFSEKLKSLRKEAKLSQEQLADKLNVSRQAVTKWESNGGTPDLDNLIAIASLFQLSLDELLDHQHGLPKASADESVTEYDIDGKKRFDISIISSKKVCLYGYEGEKIQVRLTADEIIDMQKAFKVKIDDVKQKIDISVDHYNNMTATQAKAKLNVSIYLPNQYLLGIELSDQTEYLTISNLHTDFEFSGKAKQALIEKCDGHFELNTNEDAVIECVSFTGQLDINQLSATSMLIIPLSKPFVMFKKGFANSIIYQIDGNSVANYSIAKDASDTCDTIFELNGMNSELTINAVSVKK